VDDALWSRKYQSNRGGILKEGVSMKYVIAAVLCIAIPGVMVAADAKNGYKVTYDGGSLGDVKAGSGIKLILSSSDPNSSLILSARRASQKTWVNPPVRPSSTFNLNPGVFHEQRAANCGKSSKCLFPN
jgi:hypothetical protein